MYVAVKGGERAIDHAHKLLKRKRRGNTNIAELSVNQIKEQLSLAVARVMCEGALYDRDLAALAIKQACGDLLEAIFLIRAYRTTLVRFCHTLPLQTENMRITRRISGIYKDLPGGQVLGPTFDYTHRLLDFSLAVEALATDQEPQEQTEAESESESNGCPHALNILEEEYLMHVESADEDKEHVIPDITRDPLEFPTCRAERLQILSRADEGFLLSVAYSTQRGYGRNHPFAGEIRIGWTTVWLEPEELGFPVPIGEIEISECEMVNQFIGSNTEPAQFTRGYGLAFGFSERKAMTMALIDRSLRAGEYGEDTSSPAQQEEFVLSHCDNVEAAGFVSHLKLPHYVDFQSELELIRKIRSKHNQEHAEESTKKPAGEGK